jgi:hypothetical protein
MITALQQPLMHARSARKHNLHCLLQTEARAAASVSERSVLEEGNSTAGNSSDS